MKEGVLIKNCNLKSEWGNKYIDLIEPILDDNNKIRVFTPDCKLISQDTLHLTIFGAKYYAAILNARLRKILNLG